MSLLFEKQVRSSFTLLTCPVREERSVHLSFRTLQHKGHPHPVLSRSTPRNFPSGLSPKISRPTELETRLLQLCNVRACLKMVASAILADVEPWLPARREKRRPPVNLVKQERFRKPGGFFQTARCRPLRQAGRPPLLFRPALKITRLRFEQTEGSRQASRIAAGYSEIMLRQQSSQKTGYRTNMRWNQRFLVVALSKPMKAV